jgi:hypothetical protein
MSKFADKLRSISKSSATPIGFHPSVSEIRNPAMLLIAGLSETQIKEAKTVADVNVDSGLILSDNASDKIVDQMAKALGDVPLGVLVDGISEEKINRLESLGCDFVVFDIKAAVEVLHKEKIGRFLMIEPSLDQGFVRAINSLEVDGVFINNRDGNSFIAVEHLLVYQRFVEILEKPVIMTLPSLVTKAELTNLWQAGANGVVAPLTQSIEALAELKKMIGDLPRGTKGRRARIGVRLPHHGEGMASEEDDEQGEEI